MKLCFSSITIRKDYARILINDTCLTIISIFYRFSAQLYAPDIYVFSKFTQSTISYDYYLFYIKTKIAIRFVASILTSSVSSGFNCQKHCTTKNDIISVEF